MPEANDKCGWRPGEWAEAVGLGRTMVFKLIKQGKINSKTCGAARIITTPPREFIASLDDVTPGE